MTEINTVDKIDKVITIYTRVKPYIFPAVMLAVGLLGGNVDRVSTILNGVFPPNPTTELEKRVTDLEGQVKTILVEIIPSLKPNE